jgi:glycosyltransferase involved in cell wall biosynthesis
MRYLRSTSLRAPEHHSDNRVKMNRHSICILLCKLDGERFLEEQLRSIETGAFSSTHFLVSDDQSTDGGLAIAKRVLTERGLPFTVRTGPNEGFAENFRSLILAATPDYDFYAFCDQDDVWHRDKLTAAASALLQHPRDIPALYGTRTRITDAENKPIGFSPLFSKPPAFQNALVQSIAGGNTMVMNRAALLLLQKACADVRFVSHDWFAYQMVTGAGGVFIMDQTPHIDYRQHENNAVGTNTGFWATLERMEAAIGGRYARWNDINIAALETNRRLLTGEACTVLDHYKQARTATFSARLKALHKAGVYRQTVKGTISLWAACLLKRL